MGAFLTLIATCVVMFAAAMGAGMVPLHQATLLPSLSTGMESSSSMMASSAIDASNLRVVSALGAGLLISTALAVVVPEGFHLLAAIERKAAVVAVVAEEEHEPGHGAHGHESHGSHESHEGHDHHHEHSHSDPVPHWLPGLALSSGFFFMMALDALSASPHQSCGGGGSVLGGAATTTTAATPTKTMEGGGGAAATASPPTSSAAASGALRALIVHAAADGLAVGASCAATSSARGSGAQTLAWSVAAAMALHKAPAAFGLSATLASATWGEARAKRGLLFFSLSSPVAALVTFFALLISGGGGADGSGLGVAAALLFSGGTLVHAAAVHVLPSVAAELSFSSASSSSSSPSGSSAGETSARVRYALVAGAAAPLILSALAPHEH